MAEAALDFLPAKLPEAINIKPGSYIKIHIEESEQSSSSDSASDRDSDHEMSDSETTPAQDSGEEKEGTSEPVFYDLNENPHDKGTRKGSKIVKTWDVNAGSPLGLENRGVTCYMNSAIQTLIHIPAVARYLTDVVKGKYKTVIKPNSVTMELANLHKKLNEGKKMRIYPKGMVKKLDEINCMMSEWEQEDSHEYFMSLMSRLQEDSVPKGQKLDTSIIHDIFAGSLKQNVVCHNCRTVSTTDQDFYDLSVDITKDHSIESSIKDFFAVESLKPKGSDGYQCEKCKNVAKAYKLSAINEAPEYLTIALKRFKFERDTGKKVQDPVSYSLDLDLTAYSLDKEPLKYKLVGVIVHEGRTVSSGHYVALCRQPNNEWAEYDDDLVQRVPEKTVKKHTDAYILVYSRLTQKPVKKAQKKTSGKNKSKKDLKVGISESKPEAMSPKISKLNAKRKASQEIDNLFKKPCTV